MMLPIVGLFAVLVAAVFVAVVVAIVLAARSSRSRELPAGAPRAELVANHLAELDQQLASGLLSQADYATQRNRLLGLPEPGLR
jgi:hypothetical protein